MALQMHVGMQLHASNVAAASHTPTQPTTMRYTAMLAAYLSTEQIRAATALKPTAAYHSGYESVACAAGLLLLLLLLPVLLLLLWPGRNAAGMLAGTAGCNG